MDIDVASFWIDSGGQDKLSSLIKELAGKYRISFGNSFDDFITIFSSEFMGDEQKEGYKGKYQRANSILKLCNLKGDAKIIAANGSVNISRDLLKHIQGLLSTDKIDILKSSTLIGYTNEEKHIRMKELADREKHEEKNSFKYKLNRIIDLLKGWDIFSKKVKTVRNPEGAFLFDLFYIMKTGLNYNFPIDWGDPSDFSPDVLSNSEKKKIIERWIHDLPVID
jgi:hypothetical protein